MSNVRECHQGPDGKEIHLVRWRRLEDRRENFKARYRKVFSVMANTSVSIQWSPVPLIFLVLLTKSVGDGVC